MRVFKFVKTAILFSAIALLAAGCSLFASFSGDDGTKDPEITALVLGKSQLSIKAGEKAYIIVNVRPAEIQKNIKLNWTYDDTVISADTSSAWGITITGEKEGQTSLKCSYGGYDATCIITVQGFTDNYEETIEPYIYSNTTILQTAPGITEKVFCSLYGGTAADIDGYSWSCDNTSVATIEPTGQYCLITAKGTGYARIKVTHTKASYPYYMGIYVFSDPTNVTYITTANNVLTMNMADNEQTISVSLVNGKDTSSDSLFSWELLKDGTDCPVTYDINANKAVIKPVKSGVCTLRVTHPDAAYPIDILCRVISVVKNVYIEPSSTVITVSGDQEQKITSTLQNINAGEYDIDKFSYTLDDYNVAEISGWVGNEVLIKGKANGSCKLLISHEKSAYAREVLIIVNGQISDAVDSSCYITTSQNYVKTKIGAENTSVNISLKGGSEGDENNFLWSVKSTTADGSSNDVIKLSTTNGKSSYSRAASSTYIYGNAVIEPNYVGTAVISLTHPKAAYPTEILVKVLDKNAVLTEPLYFSGEGLVKLLNGSTLEYTVNLKGANKSPSDDSDIAWKCDNSLFSVAANGNKAVITAPASGSGNTVSHLTISHNKADADKKVLILTADTEEELKNIKALYSDKLYYNLEVGDTAYCMTGSVGFDANGSYDFSTAVWTLNDSTICSIEKQEQDPLSCKVTGLKAGSAVVTVSLKGDDNKTYTCDYKITIYPKGTVQTEPEVYFTTGQNVINISKPKDEKTVNVSAVNLSSSEYMNIQWKSENTSIATVTGNGSNATITAIAEGETVIYVSHPSSQNTLKIYVRVGSEYIIKPSDPVVYISSNDVITMLKDDSPQRLDAFLMNYAGTDKSGFTFSIDREDIASISSQSTNGIAYIKPISSGQAEVTISNAHSITSKKVLVVVGNSAEELSSLKYLTTNSNVVAVGEGNTKTVSVNVKNSESIILDGFTWISSAPDIVDVTSQGANAVFTGNSIGTAIITVTNKYCKYSLNIIAQCVDPLAAASNPYIQLTSSVLTLNVSTEYTSVTADLCGGTKDDYKDFIWLSSDSSICMCYGQNEVGKIKALKEGSVYITVSHPKSKYTAQILVVCDKATEKNCYISVPSSIINMKPTDATQTITASLVNGAETDKYNFTWSLDVYDVIDFVYSANVCTIQPKQQGQVTITIHHPKAAYDQQIVVTVQEYTNFAFPDEYKTITQGNVVFETMEVPNTNVATYVKYSVENSNICSVSGTKSTAQITGINEGTTTVHAQLISSSTGVQQASADMMVYVKKAVTDACYITSSSTIYTVNKGKSQTLSATVTGSGILPSDQQNIKWTTDDTDIISITGISTDGTVTGKSIYITALKSGEALVTCSHEKSASNLQFYIVVPGSAEKAVTLNKTSMRLTKGSSGVTLKATIENAESTNEYNSLSWTVANVGTTEVCRIMGSGQNVTVYPMNPGTADITVQIPDTKAYAKCNVVVEAGKSFQFEQTGITVTPFGTKKLKYKVSPANANLTWTMNQTKDFFTYHDLGCDADGVGYVQIDGLKEGSGNLYCVTDGSAKGNLSVRIAWDYEFTLIGSKDFTITPAQTAEIGFRVNPSSADISVESTEINSGDPACACTIINNGDGTGTIKIVPKRETPNSFSIKVNATNPNNNDEVIGTQTITAKFCYDNKDILPVISFSSTDGKYSSYNSDTKVLSLGDGETGQFYVKINKSDANAGVSTVDFTPKSNVSIKGWNAANNTFAIVSSVDTTEQVYYIYSAKRPVYYPSNLSGSTSGSFVMENWKTDFYWAGDHHEWNDCKQEICWAGLKSYTYSKRTYSNTETLSDSLPERWVYITNHRGESVTSIFYGLVDNPSETGKTYSKSDFESIAWYYCPGYKYTFDGQTASIPAGIWTPHVTAEFRNSRDESYTVEDVGTIKIYLIHNGFKITTPTEIKVYQYTRKCNKNCN